MAVAISYTLVLTHFLHEAWSRVVGSPLVRTLYSLLYDASIYGVVDPGPYGHFGADVSDVGYLEPLGVLMLP